MKDIGARDIIIGCVAILIFSFGIYLGGQIATNRANQFRDIAIANAVASAPKSPLDCRDNDIIEAIRSLADKGAHVKGYQIKLEINNAGPGG